MLEVVFHPRGAPAVLREGVNAAPRGDEGAVVELLAAALAQEPRLADDEDDGEDDAVPNERAAHDEMRQTLPQMVVPAQPQRRDAAEEHLHPAQHRECFANDAVAEDDVAAYLPIYATLEVQFEVDAEADLGDEEEGEDVSEGGVDVGGELTAAVSVAEEVTDDGEDGAESLEGDVET